jgi:hypothetical protein
VSALDAFLDNLPAGAVGAVLIVIIALLSAAALAGKVDGPAKQSADDGEGGRNG